MHYIHTMEYYSALLKKMKLEGFEVNEVSQTQKDKPTSSHSNRNYKSIKLLELERGYQRLERGMGSNFYSIL